MNLTQHFIATFVLLASIYTVDSAGPGDPIPATSSFSGCKVKWPFVRGCFSKINVGVQAGQCWANQRIKNQKSAFFVPFMSTMPTYGSEGGPYGICTGCDWIPNPATDLMPSSNPADFCFFWHDKAHPVNAPGKPTIPMPIICPSNMQNNCPSLNWYEPGNKLGTYGDWKSTYEGVWFPPKDKATNKPLYCNGLNLGCDSLTNRDFQIPKIVGKCDVAKCKPRT